jgi:hypothetical protein
MTLGPLQPFDDIGMGFVDVVMCHLKSISPRGG